MPHDAHNKLSPTILYVDDEELARKYFARTVGKSYDVLVASNVDAAIRILHSECNRIHVLVTDYRMPGKNGGDLLRQVEREFPHVVRIVMTAYADRDMLLETVNSGNVFRILEKPFNISEVEEALRLATDIARARIASHQRLSAMSETLSFLAHELNTPLATMVNFARGIQQRVGHGAASPKLHTEIDHAASAVGDNARYCMAILSAFVESVRNTGAGYNALERSTASQLIQSLLDTYPLLPEQQALIHIDIRHDFDIPALPNCVALVLSSLLSNALRAVQNQPSASICFTVTVNECPQIMITDDGPGIPQEIKSYLLVDPITAHADSGGSGHRLIFCSRIMQSIGGSLLIHSEPSQTTTITLNFPAVKSPSKGGDQ